MSRHLHLVRHGQAETLATSDKGRFLTAQGRAEALKISGVLALRSTWPPDIFCVSTAERTLQTVEIIARETGIPAEKIRKSQMLYAIGSQALLQEVQKLDDAHHTVAVCGHNPSMTLLTELLSGKAIGNLPTCGSAHLKIVTDDWRSVSPGTAELLALDVP